MNASIMNPTAQCSVLLLYMLYKARMYFSLPGALVFRLPLDLFVFMLDILERPLGRDSIWVTDDNQRWVRPVVGVDIFQRAVRFDS